MGSASILFAIVFFIAVIALIIWLGEKISQRNCFFRGAGDSEDATQKEFQDLD